MNPNDLDDALRDLEKQVNEFTMASIKGLLMDDDGS